MVTVVGVRFKQAGKVYYFDPGGFELSKGDRVIVETSRGIEYGEIVTGPKDVREEDIITQLKDVIRKVTPEDEAVIAKNWQDAINAEKIAVENRKTRLETMIDIEYTFTEVNSSFILLLTAG